MALDNLKNISYLIYISFSWGMHCSWIYLVVLWR